MGIKRNTWVTTESWSEFEELEREKGQREAKKRQGVSDDGLLNDGVIKAVFGEAAGLLSHARPRNQRIDLS